MQNIPRGSLRGGEVRRTVVNMRRRLPAPYRRMLDVEAARIRRCDAVDSFAAAAADLAALRQQTTVDPVELVVAESRVETARKRFWAADADYRDVVPAEAAAG